ncbi:ferredoxin [Candidatus Woesearchaeota archaeon]|nr:MAG: ferredoxin [Candidatus Woesearchaeota archaeon]
MVWEIKQEHEKCIGCGACVSIDPDHWEIDSETGKARLKGAKTLDDEFKTQVLEVDDPGKAQEAADICPVNCISVKEKK